MPNVQNSADSAKTTAVTPGQATGRSIAPPLCQRFDLRRRPGQGLPAGGNRAVAQQIAQQTAQSDDAGHRPRDDRHRARHRRRRRGGDVYHPCNAAHMSLSRCAVQMRGVSIPRASS